MDIITIIAVAVGLAMDAFAISIVSGFTYKQLKIRHALRIAVFFGGFQAIMPLIGYLAAAGAREYIAAYDHWAAFGLLTAVGGKMIYESFKIKSAEESFDPTNVLVLLVLSVATSIDALIIGITLTFLRVSIIQAAIIIGIITFLLSYIGVFIGKKTGHFFESKIEVVGGLILIAFGARIFIGHLFF